MKRFLLIASCLALTCDVVMKASHSGESSAAPESAARDELMQETLDCGGEPCDAVVRGFRAFFDHRLRGLDANGRSCADCHMATDSFQLSPASVRGEVPVPPITTPMGSECR